MYRLERSDERKSSDDVIRWAWIKVDGERKERHLSFPENKIMKIGYFSSDNYESRAAN